LFLCFITVKGPGH